MSTSNIPYMFFEIASGLPKPLTRQYFIAVLERTKCTGVAGTTFVLSPPERPRNIIGIEHEGLAREFFDYLRDTLKIEPGICYRTNEPLVTTLISDKDPHLPVFDHTTRFTLATINPETRG